MCGLRWVEFFGRWRGIDGGVREIFCRGGDQSIMRLGFGGPLPYYILFSPENAG